MPITLRIPNKQNTIHTHTTKSSYMTHNGLHMCVVLEMELCITKGGIETFSSKYSTVKLLYSGHPWDVANWLLYKGGLIIQCTFNREVLFGTLLGGCFREVTFLYRFAL